MTPKTLTRLAMAVAGCMIAHQVASKAVRDAAFLSAWPASALPAMVMAAAAVVVVALPLYVWLLARFGLRTVVSLGFLTSAAGHAVEWRVLPGHPWVAVAIYLHVAALAALLLSGYWSLLSDLFDPKGARASYGRIAAAGTVGGLVGGLTAARVGATFSASGVLLLLSALHVLCAAGVRVIGRASDALESAARRDANRLFDLRTLRRSSSLRVLALLVVVTTTGAQIVDQLFKFGAKAHYGSAPDLLGFFAIFYTSVQLLTVAAQASVAPVLRRLGIGRTISSLPGGLGLASAVALIVPGFNMFAGVRVVEAVLRGSFFRSGYELLFVPMDPEEKRRTKTFLDVACDRAGDAIGALIVQLFLLIGATFLPAQLLAIVVGLSVAGIWIGRRLDVLYLRVVEQRLVKQAELDPPVVVNSETGWTIVGVDTRRRARPASGRTTAAGSLTGSGRVDVDPAIRALGELRSGDRARVEAALAGLGRPDALQMTQLIHLLAWDDVVTGVRAAIEKGAASHVGMLVDHLLDPEADFAIRRRIPRILGTLHTDRALDGLLRGLDDVRFEVRYQCGRAIDRLAAREGLAVDPTRIMTALERELSLPPQLWYGHRLIDRVDDEHSGALQVDAHARAHRNFEYLFSLLAAVLPREPLQVAFRGITSDNAGLQALAREYFNGVLPEGVRTKLWAMLDYSPPAE